MPVSALQMSVTPSFAPGHQPGCEVGPGRRYRDALLRARITPSSGPSITRWVVSRLLGSVTERSHPMTRLIGCRRGALMALADGTRVARFSWKCARHLRFVARLNRSPRTYVTTPVGHSRAPGGRRAGGRFRPRVDTGQAHASQGPRRPLVPGHAWTNFTSLLVISLTFDEKLRWSPV